MKKFLFIKKVERYLRYLGNFLILNGLIYMHLQFRNYREDIERNLKISKRELVDNLNLMSEEEFYVRAQNVQKIAIKEFFNTLLNKDKCKKL